MTAFNDREKAFENKLAHDDALRFKTEARRNKLVAGWAAAEMKLGEKESAAYVGALIAADLQEAGDDDVLRKIRADFDAKGVPHSNDVIRAKLDECFEQAKRQLAGEA